MTAGDRFTMDKCEVCGKVATKPKHPCRFERGCSCWHGQPCKGQRTK